MSDTEKLKENLTQAMAGLEEELLLTYARKLLEKGCSSFDIQHCLNDGLKRVGSLFESGEYFIADLMYSGMLYRSVLDILPLQKQASSSKKDGKILIGVVEQDIHDIGKDIIVGLLSAENFDVIDLGTDVSPETFIDGMKTYKPDIVLLSGMMHFAQDSMKRTVDAIRDAGLRDQVFILLGGGCIDSEILSWIDADATAYEPTDTVNACRAYLNRRSR
ncbi:MAG: hypothetical protein HFI31_11185 [Lachnospiraceae bacterium]|jgi:methanogenic corrinoid protein MtbC1|nr:hypothetical protein [Lachnospiraceae bacterium]MCI9134730.1 hypothetical protein [Lachnospiraceae bacterium]